MTVRILAIAALAALLCTPVSAATKIDDPVKFVREVYAQMQKSDSYAAPEDIYTPRLAALWALEKHEAGDEVGRVDFDFWVNGQDRELTGVTVSGAAVEQATGREIVTAKFKNSGTAEEIHFYFEKTSTGWRLDDARSLAKDAWTLSLILKYGWDAH